MEKQAVVYKITCKENNKFYIGVTIRYEKRMDRHRLDPNNKMKKDMKLYSWSSFTKEIIFENTEKECYEEEIRLIKELSPEYNTALGGHFRGSCGIENGMSKLTESMVIDIREKYYKEEFNQQELAKIFNVSNKEISKIVLGQRWSHVGGHISKSNKTKSDTKNEETIINIRKLYYKGKLSYREIGIRFNTDGSAIGRIVRGETYKNLGGPIKGIDY